MTLLLRCFWTLALLCAATVVQAQRDPTAPPAVASVSVGSENRPVSDLPWGDEGVAVIVRDGKSFLALGTRLYAVGQKIGNFRIERISETEIWLRNGSGLRKVPRFAGIERKRSVQP
jgi:hypothetical protein